MALRMPAEFTSQSARWLYALKPASWPKVLVPAAFGQVLGVAATGRVVLGAVVFGLAWTFLHVAFIVLVNDWADRAVDGLKRRMFPRGCSAKTIPDGILSARALLFAGVVACVLALAFAWAAGALLHRPLLLPLAALSALVFAAYTLPPLKLNYRGGGELLEMLGIGIVLPVLHDYAQSGVLGTPWLRAMLPGVAALALANALASGLADEVTDALGGKRTFVTTFGNAATRGTIESLVGLSSALFVAGLCLPDGPPALAVLPSAALILFFSLRLAGVSPHATTNAFGAQSAYKGVLRRATFVPLGLVATSLLLCAQLLRLGGGG